MSFFQHVRTAHLQAQAEGRPYHALGSDTEPHLEPVRFAVQNTFAFPATAVSRIDPPEQEGGPQKMEVTSMGLTGPSGIRGSTRGFLRVGGFHSYSDVGSYRQSLVKIY